MELRRKTWEATRTIGERTGALLREVAHLRNEAARALGYRDHYAMSWPTTSSTRTGCSGCSTSWTGTCARLGRARRPAIDDELRASSACRPSATLMPWHYQDRFFQEPPSPAGDPLHEGIAGIDVLAAARRYFVDLGHDVDAVLARSDLHPRPGKDQHAFQLTIDRADDVRVLVQRRADGALARDDAARARPRRLRPRHRPGLHWLLREPAHIFMTEAIAMLHGRQARDPAFLERYAGVPARRRRATRPNARGRAAGTCSSSCRGSRS